MFITVTTHRWSIGLFYIVEVSIYTPQNLKCNCYIFHIKIIDMSLLWLMFFVVKTVALLKLTIYLIVEEAMV